MGNSPGTWERFWSGTFHASRAEEKRRPLQPVQGVLGQVPVMTAPAICKILILPLILYGFLVPLSGSHWFDWDFSNGLDFAIARSIKAANRYQDWVSTPDSPSWRLLPPDVSRSSSTVDRGKLGAIRFPASISSASLRLQWPFRRRRWREATESMAGVHTYSY